MNRIVVLVTVLVTAAAGVLLTGIPTAGLADASQKTTVAGKNYGVPDAAAVLDPRLEIEPQPPTF
ncbi:MAG: hypothetical protein IPP91_15725 [Betaproteobacteria bacterium]|nr:hypothetical protein [Betaproteobacteria bacterium]